MENAWFCPSVSLLCKMRSPGIESEVRGWGSGRDHRSRGMVCLYGRLFSGICDGGEYLVKDCTVVRSSCS